MPSEYEQLRLRNIEDNKKILAELSLINPFKPLGRIVKTSLKRKHNYSPERRRVKKKTSLELDPSKYGSQNDFVRRSSRRIKGVDPSAEIPKEEIEEDEEERSRFLRVQPNRHNIFGVIEGVAVGTFWQTRMECCHAGIHRPPVAGIHGGDEGAYSIALSGGYEDDIDLGDCFTYTGEGGRDLKGTKTNPKNLRTAKQSKDQTLSRGNLALSKNCDKGNVVRVIRGYKLKSPFAPEEGYRYDGIYTVEKYWYTLGMSGFGVWKFALCRCPDQAPPPWSIEVDANNNSIVEGDDEPKADANEKENTDETSVACSSSDNEISEVEEDNDSVCAKVEANESGFSGPRSAPKKDINDEDNNSDIASSMSSDSQCLDR